MSSAKPFTYVDPSMEEFKDTGLYYRKYMAHPPSHLIFLGNTTIEARRIYVLMWDAATDSIEMTYDQDWGGIRRVSIGKGKASLIGIELFEFYEWLKERLTVRPYGGKLVEARKPWTHVDDRLQEYKDTGLFYAKMDMVHHLFLVDNITRIETLFIMSYDVAENQLNLMYKEYSAGSVTTLKLVEPKKERVPDFHMFEFYEWLKEKLLPESARDAVVEPVESQKERQQKTERDELEEQIEKAERDIAALKLITSTVKGSE